ncbi:helix-turn-helix transcriptional regulator [Frankia sp. AgPm24]|uniref:AraC family transcriptional regulator n=1 Tax=Frankia sp. AgPm24 TaxID=631128 RepID=UPI00200DBCB4|nr:helix-turn-helix transcriptional regulator [Frankia sp. AgPm24]MCK9924171.1 helix-turn-helix transcriptional regulator [Frankia sp. AgPm24]
MSELSQFVSLEDGGRVRWTLIHREDVAPHSHVEGQLVYAASGVLTTTSERGTWVAPANRISWTPPRFAHHHHAYGATEIRLIEIPRKWCGPMPDHPTVFGVSGLLREAVLKLTSGDMALPAQDRLLGVVVDELVDLPEESLHLPAPLDDRLRAVIAMLQGDPADSATLSMLGHAVGASERTLSRLFQAELGMSFYQWRTLLRVQYALVHLVDGRSVTDTALLCGWANPTSFIEAFTTVVGQTPGRYLRSASRAGHDSSR